MLSSSRGAVRIPFRKAVPEAAATGPTPWLKKTTTQMNAIPSPVEGMAVWNTTEHQLMVYDGAAWVGVPMLA